MIGLLKMHKWYITANKDNKKPYKQNDITYCFQMLFDIPGAAEVTLLNQMFIVSAWFTDDLNLKNKNYTKNIYS